MSVSIEITHAQANALASLSEREGPLAIRQLVSAESTAEPSDVYVTPHGATKGYRIAADGAVSDIGQTLPASD